jgi:hypothetical protein
MVTAHLMSTLTSGWKPVLILGFGGHRKVLLPVKPVNTSLVIFELLKYSGWKQMPAKRFMCGLPGPVRVMMLTKAMIILFA